MLTRWEDPQTGEIRLYVRHAEAWISPEVPTGAGGGWVLWVRHGRAYTTAPCQRRLEVESRLRAWLLRRYRRRLADLSFTELAAIAARVSDVRRRA